MNNETEQLSEFDQIIQPLDIMINLIYHQSITPQISKLIKLYGLDTLKNQNSLNNINEIVKSNIETILMNLSKTYLKKLRCVYSNDGVVYYIFSTLYSLFTQNIELTLSNSHTKKRSSN